MRHAHDFHIKCLQIGGWKVVRTIGVPGKIWMEIGIWLRNDLHLPLAVVPFLFIFGATSLFGQRLDLVQQQKREAARRRACAASRLAVNDANMDTLFIPGVNYHFTRMVVDPPPASVASGLPSLGRGSASADVTHVGYTGTSESRRAYQKRMSERMESQIAEAEENIQRWESQLRTIEVDCAPYAIPDKAGYIESKSEELERWIEGERYFIYRTKKRLAKL